MSTSLDWGLMDSKEVHAKFAKFELNLTHFRMKSFAIFYFYSIRITSQRSLIKQVSEESAPCAPINDE